MDAKTYLKSAVEAKRVVRFARVVEGKCVGRAKGLILETELKIAVLLEDCHDPHEQQGVVGAGAIVCYTHFPDAHPDMQFQILDKPAHVRD